MFPPDRLIRACRYIAGLLAAVLLAHAGLGASLQVEITPKFSGENLQPGSLRYETFAKESFSITRVSYLLSGIALQQSDGRWLELSNRFAWLDMQANRSSFRLDDLPPDSYRSIRFYCGLDEADNHAEIATFPADHPLNPNVNGLHWSWQGGYIFLAIEGMWRSVDKAFDGWAYHLARDTNRVCVSLAAPLELSQDTKLDLDFDLATLLNAPRALSFAKDGSSTHSRDGDPIAAALVANLSGSFRVRKVSSITADKSAVAQVKPLYLPAKYTPYCFVMSSTFPIPDLPRDNPFTEERVTLGEKLFHETALSKDGSLSCASCHQAKAALSDPRRFSIGVRDQVGIRNAMPLFNLAWKSSFFWDGRAPSLRAQALMPIQDHTEMDETLTNLVRKLAEKAPGSKGEAKPSALDYSALFESAFGLKEITAEKIGLAIETFVMTRTSFNSKFDRVLQGKEQFTPEEQHGFTLFSTEFDPRREQFGADCFHCHGGPLFQSQAFANNGLDAEFKDRGRAKITGKDSDLGKFATPSLRNVAFTAPYMHDGRFATLEEVVEHYVTGVKRSATLDPNLAKHPDGGVPLRPADKKALVAFLKTLTDDSFVAQQH
jgi:cytochrome c peroxidase